MKLNDDYLDAVQKQIAEDGSTYNRSEARLLKPNGHRFTDPAREITPYTKINLGQKGPNQSQSRTGQSSLNIDKVAEEVKKEEGKKKSEQEILPEPK